MRIPELGSLGFRGWDLLRLLFVASFPSASLPLVGMPGSGRLPGKGDVTRGFTTKQLERPCKDVKHTWTPKVCRITAFYRLWAIIVPTLGGLGRP